MCRMVRQRSSLKSGTTALALLLLSLTLSSCGGSGKGNENGSPSKLPPGITAESLDQTSTAPGAYGASSGSAAEAQGTGNSGAHREGVSLEKVNFTVTGVTRSKNNSVVVSGNARELAGDFLKIDMTVNNASGGLVKLGRFSFRLYSPALKASSYDGYYGSITTYGGYVSRNTISAALINASTLQQVDYVLRDGETVDEAFLFYDLNPLSVDANEAFTLQEAELIIYDTETGNSARISLAGFAG